jgi:two-component system LytT family sensor kinase
MIAVVPAHMTSLPTRLARNRSAKAYILRASMSLRTKLRLLGAIFLIWTLLAIPFGFLVHANAIAYGIRVSVARTLAITIINYWLYALLTPLVIFLSLRYRVTRHDWGLPLLIHLIGLGFYNALYALLRGFAFPLGNQLTGEMTIRSMALAVGVFRGAFYGNFWMYSQVVAVTLAVQYYRESRERQLQGIKLESQLSQAQLQLLKAQLQPHFLFNTLHAISTLMARDVAAARRMIVCLSQLLRMAMERAEAQELTLGKELDLVSNYLEIEKTRFQDKLQFEFNIDADVMDAMVPALLLQPLIENAVRHGIATQSKPGLISVLAAKAGDQLEITIEDNGPGLDPSVMRKEGIGLTNTRARLLQLYGAGHTFELYNGTESGLKVSIRIPIHFEEIVGGQPASPLTANVER